MPIEVLDNSNNNNQAESNFHPEVVSYQTQYLAGATVANLDIVFISTANAAAFAAMLPDTLGRDEKGFFQKVNSERKYLAWEADVLEFVIEEVSRIEGLTERPLLIDPARTNGTTNLPVGPIKAGQRLFFISNGTVTGRAVEVGGLGVVTADVPQGTPLTWQQIAYNDPTDTVIPSTTQVRADGASDSLIPTEKAVATFVKAFRDALTQDISNLRNRLIQLEARPVPGKDTVFLCDGVKRDFRIELQNRYLDPETCVIHWHYRYANGQYGRTIAQDGEIVNEGGKSYLKAFFARPYPTASFKVVVVGAVASTAQ
ncbi:MAG: hypothetical protein C6Y22_17545 [Hapalosiphonaceae cyanobacterium JJU2]|nr:MAG: hypothetical protein C6Y22_17545 [Hapalosiphonaceae cyanobacterium JJU2]